MDAAPLTIGLWRNEISVAREHAALERARADVDALAPAVAADLGLVLGSYLDAQDDAVILVRRLAFDCDLDLASDAGRLARFIARRCAYALVRAIDGRSPDVVRFASPAAFRARFITDLAAGRAWDRWYYRAFGGVRVLPASAAIRTVLLDDVAVGRATLAALDDGAWPAMLAALTPREAVRIVTGLAASAGIAMDAATRAAWIAATVLRLQPAGSPALLAVRALALALRDPNVAERVDAQTAYLAGAIAAAAGSLAPAQLLRELESHGVAVLERLADDGTRSLTRQWLDATGASCRDVIVRVAAALARAAATPSEPVGDAIATPYAGYALLLSEIDALLDDAFCAALPADSRAAAALIVLAVAAGPAHAVALACDPAWRAVLDIPPRFDHLDFASALDDNGNAVAAYDALLDRVAGHARGQPVTITFRSDDERWRATVDMPSRLWLEFALRRGGAVGDDVAWRARLSAARGARRDYDALAGHGVLQALPVAWRPIFVMLAQVAWRRIAYRVTGLAGTSLAYLRANLVGTRGTARCVAPGCYRFEMARPPLYVLLNLCGFARAEVRLSGACTIVLDFV